MHGIITQSHHNVALAGFMIHSATGIFTSAICAFPLQVCVHQAHILAELNTTNKIAAKATVMHGIKHGHCHATN